MILIAEIVADSWITCTWTGGMIPDLEWEAEIITQIVMEENDAMGGEIMKGVETKGEACRHMEEEMDATGEIMVERWKKSV